MGCVHPRVVGELRRIYCGCIVCQAKTKPDPRTTG